MPIIASCHLSFFFVILVLFLICFKCFCNVFRNAKKERIHRLQEEASGMTRQWCIQLMQCCDKACQMWKLEVHITCHWKLWHNGLVARSCRCVENKLGRWLMCYVPQRPHSSVAVARKAVCIQDNFCKLLDWLQCSRCSIYHAALMMWLVDTYVLIKLFFVLAEFSALL